MTQGVYKQMLEVMKQRRGPYTGVDIPEFYSLVEELFTPQEAEFNNATGGVHVVRKYGRICHRTAGCEADG